MRTENSAAAPESEQEDRRPIIESVQVTKKEPAMERSVEEREHPEAPASTRQAPVVAEQIQKPGDTETGNLGVVLQQLTVWSKGPMIRLPISGSETIALASIEQGVGIRAFVIWPSGRGVSAIKGALGQIGMSCEEIWLVTSIKDVLDKRPTLPRSLGVLHWDKKAKRLAQALNPQAQRTQLPALVDLLTDQERSELAEGMGVATDRLTLAAGGMLKYGHEEFRSILHRQLARRGT